MKEEQLRQLQDLLKSFGFEITSVEQNVTHLNNDPKGTISIGYKTHFTYTPNMEKNKDNANN